MQGQRNIKLMDLGDLLEEMITLAVHDPAVLDRNNEIPAASKDNYRRYLVIKAELKRRENEYRYKNV